MMNIIVSKIYKYMIIDEVRFKMKDGNLYFSNRKMLKEKLTHSYYADEASNMILKYVNRNI